MTMRVNWRKTVAAAAILGCTAASPAGTSISSAATSSVTGIAGPSFGCGAAQKSTRSGQSGASSLRMTLSGNDPTQTYTAGSKFTVTFATESSTADVIAWNIADYSGTVHAAGSINVSAGATTASVTCSSTLAGYFAVSAKLRNSGATEPQQGSRPAGYVSFGVLPNVADYVPQFAASLDERRIGLQGASYEIPGTGLEPVNENLGSTWVLSSRSQSVTEPNYPGQYNPQKQQIDPGIKEGRLARIVTLDGLPRWASTAPSPSAVGSYPPRSFSAFQSYAALVGEESARIHNQYIPNQKKNYYQVTWEPDPGPSTQWMGSDSEFVSLYKAVWEGVHSTDPDAAVMGPATQSLPKCAEWISRMAPYGYTKYLDAVACHGYYTLASSSSKPPEPANLAGQVQELRRTMANLLPPGTKLFVTETGVSYPMGSRYAANYPTAQVLEEHAEAVVRTHLIMLGEGVDTSFLFYAADFTQNVGFGMYFNLSMATRNFASNRIAPKPATMAVAAAARLVDGSRSLGALTDLPAGGYGYAFLLADKSHAMTALWAHNASFDANETYALRVDSTGTSGKTVLFDTMGNPKAVSYSDGILKVTLSEMPIYVLSPNVAASRSHVRAPEGYSTSF
jgi:hypothetical protein